MAVCCLCGGTVGIHSHHVIPRAYGGTDGECVDLCASHHNMVHTLANKLYKTRDESTLQIPDVSEDKRLSALYLIRAIALARSNYEYMQSIGKAPVKGGFFIKLTPARTTKLLKLQNMLSTGNRPLSKQQVFETALDRLFQSLNVRKQQAQKLQSKGDKLNVKKTD